MAVTEKQARARMHAFRLLEVLLKCAGMRLSVAKRDLWAAKIRCDQRAIGQAIIETQDAWTDCRTISSRVKRLGIEKRVA